MITLAMSTLSVARPSQSAEDRLEAVFAGLVVLALSWIAAIYQLLVLWDPGFPRGTLREHTINSQSLGNKRLPLLARASLNG